MKRKLISIVALVLAVVTAGAGEEFELGGQTLRVPAGFTVEVVAAPPLVERPITMAIDEAGRYYVAESSGSNEPVEVQLEKRPHDIVQLTDEDGDGVLDRRVVFADHMMFPEGTLWFDGSLYVSAPPAIWKLTDLDGDGVADRREVWTNPGTLTGCANDLHGPYLGRDGWIYWCKGAFARQEFVRPNGEHFTTRAAHLYRRHPSGGGIEAVMTGGMDNPVDMVCLPNGERIITSTFLQHPGGGRRDGLIHAVYGGVYGKVHDVIEEHPRTDPEVLPVLSHLGPAAPCGLALYQSQVFGPDYQNNLFAAQFNLQKVSRHILHSDGATWSSEDQDFLVSSSRDFHPTDVNEDADGSLLVVDTGGWYKICCPTSQLYKPDILGAIYRIRKAGAPRPGDPRGWQIRWSELSPAKLIAFLGDPRPAVRERCIQTLASRAPDGLEDLEQAIRHNPSSEIRRNAVWTASRIDDTRARRAIRFALEDASSEVRMAALHAVALWRDRGAVSALEAILRESQDPQVVRVAAEAAGRIGQARLVDAILGAIAGGGDRMLIHSLTFALIEIGDAARLARIPNSAPAKVRRATLIALDQIPGHALKIEMLLPILDSESGELKEIAHWIVSHHPEWSPELAGWYKVEFARVADPDPRLASQVAALADQEAIQDMLATIARSSKASAASRQSALMAMREASLPQLPNAWKSCMAAILTGSPVEGIRNAAVLTARHYSLDKERDRELLAALLDAARDSGLDPAIRLNALAAIPAEAHLRPDSELFALLNHHLEGDRPLNLRTTAATVLGQATLSEPQIRRLCDRLDQIGPLELAAILPAFAGSNPDLGQRFLESLSKADAFSSLRPDQLRAVVETFSAPLQKIARQLYARLEMDYEEQAHHLDELLRNLPHGDIRRGQDLFNSPRVACSSCHSIGYLGGDLGPDLTRIGEIRSQRDLLEAIVYPSSSFARGFEPLLVTTDDDEYSGILRRESPQELVLVPGPGVEIRLPQSTIRSRRPGTRSIMPAGMGNQLTPQELADLVAFLSATRW